MTWAIAPLQDAGRGVQSHAMSAASRKKENFRVSYIPPTLIQTILHSWRSAGCEVIVGIPTKESTGNTVDTRNPAYYNTIIPKVRAMQDF